jgi:cyclopropane fatty-acyl-phospholipid synthase-like methyltransferase
MPRKFRVPRIIKALGTVVLAGTSMIVIRDIAWYRFNLRTRDQTKTTQRCYDWFEHYLPKTTRGKWIDYSEGIFDFSGQPGMTLEAATENKYRYIFEKLGLRRGMKLLDAGCGRGVWMLYCQNRGVQVVGLTLSPEQAMNAREKGLEVHVMDYRVENPRFLGQFDAVTALGSTEHLCSSRGGLAGDTAREHSISTLTEVWQLFHRYLKQEGVCYLTTLTVNDDAQWSLWDYWQTYVLDQHYGGYYPRWRDIQDRIVPATGFTITDSQDHTRSYHWSSMVDPRHFGYFKIDWTEDPADKVAYFFKGLVQNPLQLPFHWLYQGCDTWMWQFGGPQRMPLTDQQVATVPMQLKYVKFEKKPKSPKPREAPPTATPDRKGGGLFTAYKRRTALPVHADVVDVPRSCRSRMGSLSCAI